MKNTLTKSLTNAAKGTALALALLSIFVAPAAAWTTPNNRVAVTTVTCAAQSGLWTLVRKGGSTAEAGTLGLWIRGFDASSVTREVISDTVPVVWDDDKRTVGSVSYTTTRTGILSWTVKPVQIGTGYGWGDAVTCTVQ